MDEEAIARALHVFGVVLWIGGVGFVTTVLLPAIGRITAPEERMAFFEQIEGRFARQARATTLLVGLSGVYLVHAWDLWDRFTQPAFFWMHMMVAVWVVFTFMLFVAEPLFLHRWFRSRAQTDPEGTFRIVRRLHWGLLTLSFATVLAATAGSHGGIGP